MNRRSLFNLTAVIVFLFTILYSCLDAFAAEPAVRAYDESDNEIVFNDNNYALNAGNAVFVLDRDALLPGEIYVYEDGGLITAVRDYTYIMEAGEDGELKFVNFYIRKGDELTNISGSPYFVEFADSIKIAPDVVYTGGTDGNAPSVTVGTRPWVQTYLCVDDGKLKTEKHITGKTEVRFADDGVYKVSVYTEDGLGNRTYSKKLPEKITVDKKPPVITSLETDIESVDEEGLIYDKTLTLSAKAWDERSEVAGIYWEVEGETVKADNLKLKPPFKGSVLVYARDSAGNVSEKTEFFKSLTIDDEAPAITVSQKADGKSGILKVGINAQDKLSGMWKIETMLDGKLLSKKTGAKDEISLDLSAADYGEKKLVIHAFDRAGNKSLGTVIIKKSDVTPPVIDIYGALDRGIYGSDVDITVDVKDDLDTEVSYSANILVRDASGKMIYSRTTDSKKLRITESGIVTVTVTAADQSGNKASSAVTFLVDRDAPKINGLENYDGKIFEKFFLKEEPEDMIDDLSCVTYDVYLNGLEYDGREVVQDGNYILKITATDEFGRKSEKRAGFTIKKDETADVPHEKEAVSANAAAQTPVLSKNAVSGNTVKKKKEASKKTLSEDRLKAGRTPEGSLSGNALSVNAVSVEASAKEGFLDRIRYGILKLFGLKNRLQKS
ncbi:MAG: hypothetical protein K6F86_08785 [Lachnospiraceae bacterium]|nr:hypothetical protein [Lachnospiraceae bacterium]